MDINVNNSGYYCFEGASGEGSGLRSSGSQQMDNKYETNLNKNRTTVVSRINLNAISSIYDRIKQSEYQDAKILEPN